jgi:hypothetical protein
VKHVSILPQNSYAFQRLTALWQALIEAELLARYRSLRTSTLGIVFLATPHRGSRAADFGSIVASAANMVTPGMRFFNPHILRDLKKGSPALYDISGRFSNICTGIWIHTFYETGGAHQVCASQIPRPVALVA